MTRKIEIVPYNPAWPQIFEEEATIIRQALGENCVALYHVGSTSILGLTAKPQIDIIVAVKDLVSAFPSLIKAGYTQKGEFNIPFHMVFDEREGRPRTNVHVFEEDNPEIELNLLFRDYLRSHSEMRDEYGALKQALLERKESHDREKHGLSGYNLGKDAFIRKILNQAGFNGLCMRSCTHHEEWKTARILRNKNFFDKISIADPYTWTFDHKDHVHLVLYKGTHIIGYAHLQLWPEQRAALRIIAIDDPLRGQGLGGKFLSLCERWLNQKGFHLLQTQASPEAHPFYLKYGYTEMPFNDPDGHEGFPQDIDMGKVLGEISLSSSSP